MRTGFATATQATLVDGVVSMLAKRSIIVPPGGCSNEASGQGVVAGWPYPWHRFIDQLAEEKATEEFFERLK